jgi:hypothetical protein
MIDEELVQLLTPEGERVENSEYESTLNGDEIFGFYRDMVIIRRLCNESTSGTARALGAHPGPRGRTDRRRPRPGPHGLHLPDVP